MKCPYCHSSDIVVKNSRPSEDGNSTKRRRECLSCKSRFNTEERIIRKNITVKKNAGRVSEPLNIDKIYKSINVALRKRPISNEQKEIMVNNIVKDIESVNSNEITSQDIGEIILKVLLKKDIVAYIRFASVYKDFNILEDFQDFIAKSIDK